MDKAKIWLLFCLLLVWGSSQPSVFAAESLIQWQIQSEESSPFLEGSKELTNSESSSQGSEETSTTESTSSNESTNQPTNQTKLPQTSSVASNKSITLWGIILITLSCYVSIEGKRTLKNEEKNS